MYRSRKLLFVAAALTFGTVFFPVEAQARKKGPLEGEPIVRSKLQLRRFRFQLTPFVAMSLSQPFVHMGYVGAKAGFHFADWIGVRAGFAYGIVPVESRLLKAINDGGLPVGIAPGQPDPTSTTGDVCPADGAPCRPVAEQDNPAPLLHDFRAGLTRAQWQSSIDVVFTPFAGKMGLFSAIFTEYDIYVFGGLGLMGWSKHYSDARSTAQRNNPPLNDSNPSDPDYCRAGVTAEPNTECLLHPVKADTGVKVGGSFGAGMHVFLTDWVAINLEVQDIVTGNNLAGLNTTIDDVPPVVNNDDKDAFHNVTFQLGAKFYIPFKAKRTR